MPVFLRNAWNGLIWALLLLGWLAACAMFPSPRQIDNDLRIAIDIIGVTPLSPGPKSGPAQIVLGRALFFDKELSGYRDISCATCHHPQHRTGDGISVSIGVGGGGLGPERRLGMGRHFIPRNAPDLFSRGAPEWATMFWDSRVQGGPEIGFISPAGSKLPAHLESILAVQAMFPVTSRDEMRGKLGDVDVYGRPNELALVPDANLPAIWDLLMDRILAIPGYRALFRAAYPDLGLDEIGFEHAANAIAAFEAAFWTSNSSPWDRYISGDLTALSPAAKRGALLFYGEAGCGSCHSGPLLTDQDHNNIGVPQLGPGKGQEAPLDFGRARESFAPGDMFAFRTPALRNVTLTGPWMHNGAYATLEGAVRHHLDPQESLLGYDVTQLAPELRSSCQTDPGIQAYILATLDPLVASPKSLSAREMADLIAFLDALTDPSAVNQLDLIPESVPSGLPVSD